MTTGEAIVALHFRAVAAENLVEELIHTSARQQDQITALSDRVTLLAGRFDHEASKAGRSDADFI